MIGLTDLDLPQGWQWQRLKFLLSRNDGGAWGSDPDDDGGVIVLRSTEQSVDGRWIIDEPARRKLSHREFVSTRLETGDLVLTKSSGSELHIGKTTLVTEDVAELNASFSNFMQRLRPRTELHPRFAWYFLNCALARTQFDVLSNSTSGLANLNATVIGEIQIPQVALSVQQKVVNYLDRETAEIDVLIEKQERLIALLEEKRQAFISHAVTKGLDPTVPMKDSGIPWIGMIPAHWQQARLKRHWKVLDCKHITAEFQDEGYPLASIGEVQSWRVNLSNAKRTSGVFFVQLTEGGRKPRPNDIILSRNATVGQTALVDADHPEFALGQDVCLIRGLRPSVEGSHFLMFLFRSSVIQQQLEELMIGATIRRINVEAVRNLSITIPPLLELPKIVEALNAASEQQANLVNTANRAKDVLLERRAALISAAVTGKIDVTGRV